jgi:hypothetical protein
MPLQSGQREKKCGESPFSIFCVKSAGLQFLNELPLPVNNPVGLGQVTFGQGELIVGAAFLDHTTSL